MTGPSARPSIASSIASRPGAPPSGNGPGLYLGSPDLHLWLCRVDCVPGSDEFRRQVLSRYAPVDPLAWRFEVGEQGKPRVANAPTPLDFNLSHSGDWLACAVTSGTAVGVDIEYCKRRRDVMKLAGRFFHEREVTDLQAMPAVAQVQRFYDYWTLKEASVKCGGQALAPALPALRFQLPVDEGVEMRIVEKSQNARAGAHYWLFDPVPDYRLALCWLPHDDIAPRLRLFQQDPGAGVRELRILLRASSIPTL